MTAPLAIGLVGCGRLAEAGYLPAAKLAVGVRIAAVADPDAERRAALAGDGAAEFASVDELLAAAAAEALVVASPPATHEHAAAAAAAAGVPALVEKPPAPDAAGAERIAALDPAPWIGFNRRFSLGRGAVGALPEGGSVEAMIRYRRFSWAPVAVRDPALIDLAPHLIDLALRAGLGEVREVRARSQRAERIAIELRGERGSARLEGACDRLHRESLVVRGAEGDVVLRRGQGGLVRGLAGRLRPGPHPLVASLAAQLQAFAAAARGEPAPDLASAADGLAVMRAVAAAAESLAHGGEPTRPGSGARA